MSHLQFLCHVFPGTPGRRVAAAGAALSLALAARASQDEMAAAGSRYAANDVDSAVSILDKIVGRGGKTVWLGEALLLRARIKAKDRGDRKGALRDLRLVTVHLPGTAAGVVGQFRIAGAYEDEGLLADAFREYTLCSRMLGPPAGRRADVREDDPPGPGDVPRPRATASRARRLADLAALRAALVFGRVPEAALRAAAGTTLPPRTFVVSDPGREITVPADPTGKPASGVRADSWYVVAPHGRSITGVEVELVAAVDYAAAGPQGEKSYGLVVEALPRFPSEAGRVPGARRFERRGASRRPEKLTGSIDLAKTGGGAAAVRLFVRRSGARVLGCRVRVAVAAAAPAEAPRPEPPPGFSFAVKPSSPSGAGTGGVALARGRDGTYFLAYHSPARPSVPVRYPTGAVRPSAPSAGQGRGDTEAPHGPDEDSDLFLVTSPDGKAWSEPERLKVSSAADDVDPSLAVLRDGRLALAWTSDRRGGGTSDIYISTSRDGKAWSAAHRLEINANSLEGMGSRVSLKTGSAAPRAHVTFHEPELSVSAEGRARLFFVAHGYRYEGSGNRKYLRLSGTGLYGMVSEVGRWTKPEALVTTPRVPLERLPPLGGGAPAGGGRPPSRAGEREVIAADGGPSVIERLPRRSLVAWLSSYGRVVLTQRDEPERNVLPLTAPARPEWRHFDTRFAGASPSQAAGTVRLVGPFGNGGYGVIVVRRDIGARICWRDRRQPQGWRVEAVVKRAKGGDPPAGGRPPAFAFGDVAVAPASPAVGRAAGAAKGRAAARWLTAWTAAAPLNFGKTDVVSLSEPTGVYVKEIAPPDGLVKK